MKFPTGQIFHIPFSSHNVLYVASISLIYLFKLYFMLTFTLKKVVIYTTHYIQIAIQMYSVCILICVNQTWEK